MPSGSHQARRCVQCLASHTDLSPPPPQKISAAHRACRWLDRETARIGQASFVAQAFILIESDALNEQDGRHRDPRCLQQQHERTVETAAAEIIGRALRYWRL